MSSAIDRAIRREAERHWDSVERAVRGKAEEAVAQLHATEPLRPMSPIIEAVEEEIAATRESAIQATEYRLTKRIVRMAAEGEKGDS